MQSQASNRLLKCEAVNPNPSYGLQIRAQCPTMDFKILSTYNSPKHHSVSRHLTDSRAGNIISWFLLDYYNF